jgi:aryl-alcohol dehydrogenase-like predicted oxidoreductase
MEYLGTGFNIIPTLALFYRLAFVVTIGVPSASTPSLPQTSNRPRVYNSALIIRARQENAMKKQRAEHPRHNRRDFMKLGGVTTAVLLTQTAFSPRAQALPSLPENPATPQAMPTRNLGKTGYRVGVFSLGGQAAIERANNEAVAVPIVGRALDLGVNYIDTSSIYGGPERWSERYIGQVMKTRRSQAFLASKTKERTREGSLRMIEQSLKLLNTDHLDLWQLHDIGTMTDVNEIFAKGGAIEALHEMQQQKVVRFLGLTGHYRPDALMECIHRHPFDCILMAVNAADKHHFSFMEELLPLAVEKQMGIIGMKVPARGRILSSWTPPPLEQQKHSWEGMVLAPTPGTINMREAMYYSLSLPVSTVIIGCDSIAQLEENVKLAREFTPLSEQQMAILTAKVEPVSKQSLFFRFYERA